MSTEVTNEEPVLVLDDKKYVISDLSEQAKYFIACLNDVEAKLQGTKVSYDTLLVAKMGFTERLKEEVEKPQEEVSEEEGA